MRGKPGRTAVYRLYDAANRLLYVGVGELPATRWQDHRGHKAWWSDVDRASVVWRPTRDEALAEETLAIETENPVYNVLGTSRFREISRAANLRSNLLVARLDPPYCGTAEIRRRLGVSRQRVHQIINSAGFPAPCDRLAMGKVWDSEDVEQWIRQYRPDLAEPGARDDDSTPAEEAKPEL